LDDLVFLQFLYRVAGCLLADIEELAEFLRRYPAVFQEVEQ
jgi:hypothetical protein